MQRSKEWCENISKALKGRTLSLETREKLSKAHVGKPAWNKGKTGVYSEESRKKMSESRIGKMVGEKHPLFGKPRPDDVREKISQSLKEKHFTPWNKGKHTLSLEMRKKLSDSQKGEKNKNWVGGSSFANHIVRNLRKNLKKEFAHSLIINV